MPARSAYDILRIEPGASDDVVRSAFSRLAKVLHPDVNKGPKATQEFKDLKWAYDTLRDPSLRTEHEYALARVQVADVEDDIIDSVLHDYSIAKPKKKKKKKKKAKSAADLAQEEQARVQFQGYHPPPYAAPQQVDHGGRGRGYWDAIPEGFDNKDNLGGIL